MHTPKHLAIAALLCIAFTTATANPRKIGFSSCTEKKYMVLKQGDTLVVTCDSVLALNDEAYRFAIGSMANMDSLVVILHQRLALAQEISRTKDSINNHFDSIITIQNIAYTKLRSSFGGCDTLVQRATANTDRALADIRKLKVAGFISGGLFGAVGGRLIGDNWLATGIGAVVGLGLTYLVVDVLF